MKDCFGKIFPDLEQIEFGRPVAGRVFQILVRSRGPCHRERSLQVDASAWKECEKCDDFRSCYDFSTAKLNMQRVIREI
jgi:hypothetical protein